MPAPLLNSDLQSYQPENIGRLWSEPSPGSEQADDTEPVCVMAGVVFCNAKLYISCICCLSLPRAACVQCPLLIQFIDTGCEDGQADWAVSPECQGHSPWPRGRPHPFPGHSAPMGISVNKHFSHLIWTLIVTLKHNKARISRVFSWARVVGAAGITQRLGLDQGAGAGHSEWKFRSNFTF